MRLPVTISESELKGRSRRRACSSSVFAKGNDVAHRVHSGSPAAKVRGIRLGNPNGARALPGKQVGNADVMAKINANASLRLRTSRALSRPKDPQSSRFRGIASALNEQGIQAPRGGTWDATAVSRVFARLRSEVSLERRLPCLIQRHRHQRLSIRDAFGS